MKTTADVIVVGSGASATAAAFPLVRAGLEVQMLDVGNTDSRYASRIPGLPFHQLRTDDEAQHRYFLGDDFEGVAFDRVRVGSQLTPPRGFIRSDVEKLTPAHGRRGFHAFESLALGGLAAGWGAVSPRFTDRDLADFPIRQRDLEPHYEAVAARIGISGARDDLLPYYGDLRSLLPPLDLDAAAGAMLDRYERVRGRLNAAGFFLGRARLATLSSDHRGREGNRYHDLDFYSDAGRSTFRPAYAVEELRRFPNFAYVAPLLVERFRELPGLAEVEVEALQPRSGVRRTLRARRLVLAAGTMGSARIVLRSFGRYDTALPLAVNPFIYFACLDLPMVGRRGSDRRHSLSQLAMIHDPDPDREGVVHGQTFSYRSLLFFKIVKESFLPVPETLRIQRELLDAFVIVSLDFEDRPSASKGCLLRRGGAGEPDVLELHYRREVEERRRQGQRERTLRRCLRKLGCWPFRRIDPGPGASIHYGGTLPMTTAEREWTTTPDCRLRGTRSVYIADGSTFPSLPAKPLTLTLMANAERVGDAVAREIA